MNPERNQVPETYYAKHMTVDVSEGGAGKRVGNVLSSRMPIHVKDEGGSEIHGFFTENESNDKKAIFSTRTRDVASNPDNQPFLHLLQAVGRQPGLMERIAEKAVSLAGMTMSPVGNERIVNEKTVGSTFVSALHRSSAARSFFASYLDNHVPNITKDEIAAFLSLDNYDKVQRFTTEVVGAERTARNMEGTHQRIHDQYLGSGVNKRNNAMSDYAELLGTPNLIAKSVPMTVVKGEQTVHGTFMANADGLDFDDLSMYRPGFSYKKGEITTAKTMELSGEGMRDVCRLQVLDYLCANIDRHAGNMFYQFDTSDPQKVRLVGVQGIDNDASFGFVNHKGEGTECYMSRLEDIRYMDAEQAKMIMAMKPEDMNEKIRLADLSEEEVTAANRRLADLQEQIRQGNIEMVSSPAEWKDLAQPGMLQSMYRQLGVGGELEDKKNIFYMVSGVVSQYNKSPYSSGDKEYGETMTFGKLTSLQEDVSLAEQMRELKALQEQAKDAQQDVPGMAAVADKAREAIEVMELAVKGMSPEQVAGFTMKDLKPADRNELAELLQDLADTSNRFAKTVEQTVQSTIKTKMAADQREMQQNPKKFTLTAAGKSDTTVKAYETAKSMAAHAVNTKQSVLADSMEAEKRLAAKLARDIAAKNPDKAQGIAGKDRKDYSQIKAKLPKVDSRWIRSSKQFKNMMEQFNNIEKSQNYAELSKKAKEYLDYKMPFGHDAKLSDYAKARVAFAKEILEWTDQRNEDGLTIAGFVKSCQETLDQFKRADSPDAGKQVLEGYKEQFRAGYRQMLQIAECYPQDREMQTVCNTFLHNGPINGFLHALHGTLPPDEQKKADIYQAAGLDSSDYFRGKQITERHQKLSAPQKAAGKAVKTPQAEAPQK